MKEKDLHSFPQINNSQMIQLFEDWILFISKFYSQKNTIQPYELADLRQFIKIRLVEQLPKIKANYKGEST
ncbi:MAG: hypothetical protein AB8B74_01400, partial [Crocinitomicaceae bacterium]